MGKNAAPPTKAIVPRTELLDANEQDKNGKLVCQTIKTEKRIQVRSMKIWAGG
jgi:hypothetical protein